MVAPVIVTAPSDSNPVNDPTATVFVAVLVTPSLVTDRLIVLVPAPVNVMRVEDALGDVMLIPEPVQE